MKYELIILFEQKIKFYHQNVEIFVFLMNSQTLKSFFFELILT